MNRRRRCFLINSLGHAAAALRLRASSTTSSTLSGARLAPNELVGTQVTKALDHTKPLGLGGQVGLGAVGRRIDTMTEGFHEHGESDAVGVLVDGGHDFFGLDEIVGWGGAARGRWRGAARRAWGCSHVSELVEVD